MNDIQIGYCKFCGQAVTVRVTCDSQAEADERAIGLCSCAESREYCKLSRLKDEAKLNIREVFGEDSEKWKAVDSDVIELMETAVDMLADNKFRSITIAIPGAGTAKLAVNSKGGIEVERKKTSSEKLTAEK